MKKLVISILVFGSILTMHARQTPTTVTVAQKIGATKVSIAYDKTSILDTKGDDDVTHFKQAWRRNLNGTTIMTIDKPVKINGISLKPGTYSILFFPGNDWVPKEDAIRDFPGNDWSPRNDKLIFPGNDWSPKHAVVKFPGNDWKPKQSKTAFPGNDWQPVNELMKDFPGNDWLVVFYLHPKKVKKVKGKWDKNQIAAEIMVHPEQLMQRAKFLNANFVNFNEKGTNITLAWNKTMISIPVEVTW